MAPHFTFLSFLSRNGQDYKVFLEGMITSDGKKDADLKDFKENHTDSTVAFTVVATKEKLDEFENGKDGLYGKFRLTSLIHASNMHLFALDGKIAKYESPEQILKYFYSVRLQYYSDRKENLLKNLRYDQRMLSNRARFVEEVCTGDLIVSNRKRKELLSDLKEREYDLLPKQSDKSKPQDDAGDESDSNENENEDEADLAKGYEYLLGMKIWSLTFEKAEKLRRELAEKTKAVEDLEVTLPTQIWFNDLDAIEAAMDDRDISFAEAAEAELMAQNKTRKHQAAKKKKETKGRKPKKISRVCSDNESNDDDFVVETKKSKKAPVRAQANRKQPKKVKIIKTVKEKPSPLSSESEVVNIDSDSEPETMALCDRLRYNLVISPAPKKFPDNEASSTLSSADSSEVESGKKRSPEKGCNDSLDSFETETFEPAPLTPAPKKIRRGNKKQVETCEKDNVPKNSTKRLHKPAAKKRATKKKVVEDLVSSDDDMFDEDLFDKDKSIDLKDDEPLPARSRSTRGKRAVVKYVVDDKSESESDGLSDDESDF